MEVKEERQKEIEKDNIKAKSKMTKVCDATDATAGGLRCTAVHACVRCTGWLRVPVLAAPAVAVAVAAAHARCSCGCDCTQALRRLGHADYALTRAGLDALGMHLCAHRPRRSG
jgi:hypothetical protein